MSKDKRASNGHFSGVYCQVENCRHHAAGDMCTADSIDVKNEQALTKAETFCGTFAPSETWGAM